VKPLASKVMLWAIVALALLGTLMLYQRPDFLVNLADQVWSCF
jgi:hypothetical protein